MAPTSLAKVVKPGEKDIRMFFKGSSGQKTPASTPISTLGSRKEDAIEINDEDSKTKKRPLAKQPSKARVVDIDDEPVVKKRSSKPKKASALLSSDESDDGVKVKKNPPPQKPSRKVSRKSLKVDDSDDDVPVSAARKRKKPTALVSSDEEEFSPPKKKSAVSTKPKVGSTKDKPAPKASTSKSKLKPKKRETDDDDFDMRSPDDSLDSASEVSEEEEEKPRKPVKKAAVPKKSVEKAKAVENGKGKEKEVAAKPQKYDWVAAKAAKLAGPSARGSKEVPDGAPDCLAGLSFVFTGELSSFSRDEAIDLAKRFGGRVVLQPSSKTDYVVLGDNAGPSKIAAIKKHKINTLSEDELLGLIATRKGSGKIDEKTKKKMDKEQAEIKKAAKEMEKREEKEHIAAKSGKTIDPSTQLWTTRYAPQSLKEVCGNKTQVEKLQLWLHDWSSSLKSGFKKPGKNGMNVFRAVLITGSPGIGKTTSAHLCAKLEGYTPIELNASDARSKKLVENGMNINNKSLDGYVNGAHDTNSLGVQITDKTCLIMDEVDGMSAGDRGGVGALNALIKKTKIPIICIANDRQAQKLKPLVATTFNLTFQKPQVNSIRSRILTIAFKEKMKIPANVIDQLITGAQSDIRQVLNMLSTWKLSNDAMSFDEGKNLAKMNEKYSTMSPFDITSKMLGPYLFSHTARETLGEKMEYYFQDHAFVPLFIQENYLKTQPAKLRNLEGPEKILKELELMDKAASSISDGDLVDALIHGPEQHWGLMPLHAVCSTVRPSSFLYGTGAHYGGPNSMSFPQWLGQNSKQTKLNRQLGDVQIQMRLKVSGDKHEIRQSYIPALFPHIVKPLMDVGASAVDEVIERMDDYYLNKESWDTIVELGVDAHKDVDVLKKITAATKSNFTRKYNATEHPIPFHKAQDLGKVPKKLAGGPAPDIEEAYEADDIADEASDEETKNKDDSDDVSKDSLIKAPKKKKPAAASSKTKSSKSAK